MIGASVHITTLDNGTTAGTRPLKSDLTGLGVWRRGPTAGPKAIGRPTVLRGYNFAPCLPAYALQKGSDQRGKEPKTTIGERISEPFLKASGALGPLGAMP